MAIAPDASSPARFNLSSTTAAGGTESGTSASFTPPAGAWVYCSACVNSTAGATPTFGNPTNTGGGLGTWAIVLSKANASGGSSAVWRAFVNSSVATTVTISVTNTGSTAGSIPNDAAGWVDVWTGAATSQAGAATNSGTSTTANLSASLTTTATGSRVAGVACDWAAAGTPTSTDTINGYTQTGQTSGGRAYKSSNSGAAGAQTLNFHSPGTPQWAYVVYEILAAGGSTFNVSGSDSLGLADSATNTLAAKATGSDSLGLADSASNKATLLASGSDSLALSDTGAGGSIFANSASDSLGLSDSATRTSTLPASGSDSLALSDSTTSILLAKATGADSLALTDAGSAILQAKTSGSDSLALADSVTATQSGASASDALGLGDTASATIILSATALDELGLSDSSSATGGSTPTPPPPAIDGSAPGVVRKRKKKIGPVMRDDQVFGEEYAIATRASPGVSEKTPIPVDPPKKSSRNYSSVVKALLRELL